MKNTILSILLVLALLMTLPVISVGATEGTTDETTTPVTDESTPVTDESTPETEEPVTPEVPVHTHCVCGGSAVGVYDHVCDEDALTWEPWPEGVTNFAGLESGHNYYLTEDVVITSASNVGSVDSTTRLAKSIEDFKICLNGFTMSSTNSRVVGYVNPFSSISFCDCSGTQDAEGNWTWKGSVIAGEKSGTYGGILYTYSQATVNVYGGNFTGMGTGIIGGTCFVIACDRPQSDWDGDGILFTSEVGSDGKTTYKDDGDDTSDPRSAATFNMYNGYIYGSAASSGNGGLISTFHAANLNIHGGTVTGGKVSSGTNTRDGGNIWLASGVLTITGGTITKGETSKGSGGNIYISNGGDLVITGGVISDGKCAGGGGGNICLIGNASNPTTITVTGGTITGGQSGNGYNGGSIRINTGYTTTALFENCTITGGYVPGNAGGGNIYSASPVTIRNCVITDGEGSRGGNLAFTKSATITGSTISDGNATGFSETVDGVKQYDEGRGGGNILVSGGTLTLGEGNTISGGTAPRSRGGSIYLATGTLKIQGGTISGGSAGKGGNIYAATNTTIEMSAGTVTGGTATGKTKTNGNNSNYGGGNLFLESASMTMSGGTVEKGVTNYSPAGNIYLNNAQLTMTDGIITEGDALTHNTNKSNDYKTAGDVNLQGTASFTISGGTVSKGNGREGGCIRIGSGCVLNISGDALITEGTAINGGNIVSFGTVNMSGGTLSNGTATGAGGNIQCFRSKDMDATTTLSGGTISGGTAGTRGGNVYVAGSTTNYGTGYFVMTGGTVCNGTANGETTNSGGGNIYVNTLGNATITGGTISGGKSKVYGHNVGVYQGAEPACLTIAPAEGAEVIIEGGEGGYASVSAQGPLVLAGAPVIEDLYINGNCMDVSALSVETPIALTLEQSGVFATATTDKTASFDYQQNYPVFYNAETGELYTAVAAVVGGDYNTFTVQQAIDKGGYVALAADCAEELTMAKDLYLDLAGHQLTGTIGGTGTLYGYDSTSDEFVEGTGAITGTVSCQVAPYFQGTSNTIGSTNRYLTVADEEGYTFHRFDLGVTHVTVKPTKTGLGYKAAFKANDTVKALLSGYGYNLQLDGAFAPVQVIKTMESFESGKTVTLRVDNFNIAQYGTTDLTASVFLKLADGTVIESGTVKRNMKQMLEAINDMIADLSDEQITAVQAMIADNEAAMADWAIAELIAWGKTTEEVPEETTEATEATESETTT